MREQPADDTTKEPARAPQGDDGREQEPGRYYYDDGTGYELYDPSEEDPDDSPEEEPRVEKP
jgi:hypothetical protein